MAKRGHDSVGRQVRGYVAAMPLATRRVLKRIRSDIRAVSRERPRSSAAGSRGSASTAGRSSGTRGSRQAVIGAREAARQSAHRRNAMKPAPKGL